MARDRVEDPDRVSLPDKIGFPLRIDEAEIDRFLIVGVGEPLPQDVRRALRFGLRAHHHRRSRRTGRNAVEAVYPRDFLDEILLDLDVETERGRSDHEGLAAFARVCKT